MTRRLIAIVGPTATGKSSLAVELARALGGASLKVDAFTGIVTETARVKAAAR